MDADAKPEGDAAPTERQRRHDEADATPAEQQWRDEIVARRNAIAAALDAFAPASIWRTRLQPILYFLDDLQRAFDVPWRPWDAPHGLVAHVDPKLNGRGARVLMQFWVMSATCFDRTRIDILDLRHLPTATMRRVRRDVSLAPLCRVGAWLLEMFIRARILWRDTGIGPREEDALLEAYERLREYH